MNINVDVNGIISLLLLGKIPGGDDDRTVIGISRVAYLTNKDPGHIFLDAARWHDAAYTSGASIQKEWPRWKVDEEFLKKMIDIAHADIYDYSEDERFALEKEAVALFLVVRRYGGAAWEGAE